MGRAGQPFLGQGLQHRRRQPQVLLGCDLEVHRRASDDRHLLAESLDKLRVVGHWRTAAAGIGVENQLPAKDLGRLRFPQPLAGNRFVDGLT
jgi:hypothetical protein